MKSGIEFISYRDLGGIHITIVGIAMGVMIKSSCLVVGVELFRYGAIVYIGPLAFWAGSASHAEEDINQGE